MPEQNQAAAPPAKNAGNVIRWIAFIPAALFGSSAVNFAATRLTRAILGLANLSFTTSLGTVQTIGIFIGAVSFLRIGAWVAPKPRRKAIWTLFWLIVVLEILIELFRAPLEYEPLPHSVRIMLAIFGALCGLLPMLWLNRRKPTEVLLSLPQNPWSSN